MYLLNILENYIQYFYILKSHYIILKKKNLEENNKIC